MPCVSAPVPGGDGWNSAEVQCIHLTLKPREPQKCAKCSFGSGGMWARWGNGGKVV